MLELGNQNIKIVSLPIFNRFKKFSQERKKKARSAHLGGSIS